MKCPSCPETTLVMADRQAVEIDYCPSCRGIWLDRGELDKLLDRAAATQAASAPSPVQAPLGRQPDFHEQAYRDGQRHYRSHKKSWLHEIFD